MKIPYKLKSDDIRDDEVKFHDGLLSTSIRVDYENRGHEEIGYSWEKEKFVEAALSHQHGPTTYYLEHAGDDVIEVLKDADVHFQNERRLIEKYADSTWSAHRDTHMLWEGQKSIIVGRCDGLIVGIACLDLRFISDDEASKTKYFSVGIGPFFVPPHLRGRAHSIELSIAVSHLCTVLLQALYHQVPAHGCLGVSLYPDYPGDEDAHEVHPFIEQVYDKLVLVREMLAGGYLSRCENKHAMINFLPVKLEF